MKWLYVLQRFTKFKAANHFIWWRDVRVGCSLHNSTSLFLLLENRPRWNMPVTRHVRQTAGRAGVAAAGPPTPVTLGNRLRDFVRCCPTAAEILAPGKAEVGDWELQLPYPWGRGINNLLHLYNLPALEKHGQSCFLSFIAGGRRAFICYSKNKILKILKKKNPNPNLAKSRRVFFLSMKQWYNSHLNRVSESIT